jgi:hypothetical protein
LGPQFILAFGLAPVLLASSVSGQSLRVTAGTIEAPEKLSGGPPVFDLADARAARVTLTKFRKSSGSGDDELCFFDADRRLGTLPLETDRIAMKSR